MYYIHATAMLYISTCNYTTYKVVYFLISNIHSDLRAHTVIPPHLLPGSHDMPQESYVMYTISLCLLLPYPHNSGAPPRQKGSSQETMILELPSSVVLLLHLLHKLPPWSQSLVPQQCLLTLVLS